MANNKVDYGTYTDSEGNIRNYSPFVDYTFTDENGNTFTSRGDNGYVWQAIESGTPLTINSKGEWYVVPYIEAKNGKVVANIPTWFKSSDEYSQWQDYASQISSASSLTTDTLDDLNTILKELGKNSLAKSQVVNIAKGYGITDTAAQQKYLENQIMLQTEESGNGDAQFTWASDSNKGFLGKDSFSAKDIADYFSSMSKEQLSKAMTTYYDELNKAKNGTSTSTQEELVDILTAVNVLNAVDDNYGAFDKSGKYKGLLQASEFQKYNTALGIASATLVENNFLAGLIVRGLNAAVNGDDLDDRIDYLLTHDSLYGASLEGTGGSQTTGLWIGTGLTIAATILEMRAFGVIANTKLLAGTGLAKAIASIPNTVGGTLAKEFILNDLPQDIMMFINDVMRTDGDLGTRLGKALWNEEEKQPLTGIPFLTRNDQGDVLPSGFGPEVPGGLVMNIVGDLIVDCAPKILSIVNKAYSESLDAVSAGGYSRTIEKVQAYREDIKIKNIEIQNKIADTKVFGTVWKKFINKFMGEENANYIREARKTAVEKHDMSYYTRAHNILTLKNHLGAEAILPIYRKLDNDYKISKSIDDFAKNTSKYGDILEVKVEWKKTEGGEAKTYMQVVPDKLPGEVKQGVLDYQRLYELKGQEANESLISNTSRTKEIAALEKKIEALKKNRPEIIDFANRLSDMNKEVERIGVALGITDKEWVDALNLNPEFAKYMTRQSLVPGFGRSTTGSQAPYDSAILNKSRKGYYAKNYLDPTIALEMKVEALGKAYAWNEQAKSIAAMKRSTGGIKVGVSGMKAAEKLSGLEGKLEAANALREQSGYNSSIDALAKDFGSISRAFSDVYSILNRQGDLSIRSVYGPRTDGTINGMIHDFSNGKITFADGVKEAAGISDFDANAVIKNTYAYSEMEHDIYTPGKSKQGDNAKSADQIMGDLISENGVELERPVTIRNERGEVDFLEGTHKYFNDKMEKLHRQRLFSGEGGEARKTAVLNDEKIIKTEKAWKKSEVERIYKTDDFIKRESEISEAIDKRDSIRSAINEKRKIRDELKDKLIDIEARRMALGWQDKAKLEAEWREVREKYDNISDEFFELKYTTEPSANDLCVELINKRDAATGKLLREADKDNYERVIKELLDNKEKMLKEYGASSEHLAADKLYTRFKDEYNSWSNTYADTFMTAEELRATLELNAIKRSIPQPDVYSIEEKVLSSLTNKESSVPFRDFQHSSGGALRRGIRDYNKTGIETAEFKKAGGIEQVKRVDGYFNQRLTTSACFYRGEPVGSSTIEGLRVGDKLDTSSWTYLATGNQYTERYKDGLTATGGKRNSGSENTLTYRYHLNKGQPVFNDWDSNGMHEFIIPRNADAYITKISEGVESVNGVDRKTTIVDVEVDPSTGVTPNLKPLKKEVKTNVADNIKGDGYSSKMNSGTRSNKYAGPAQEVNPTADFDVPYGKLGYNYGLDQNGVPYRYKLEDGKIVSLEKVDSYSELAEAFSYVNKGNFRTNPGTMETIGYESASVMSNTPIFFRDNMPILPIGVTMKTGLAFDNYGNPTTGTGGYVYSPGSHQYNYRIEDGEIKADFDTYLALPAYNPSRVAELRQDKIDAARSGWHPKNSGTLYSTATHEAGHAYMNRLCLLGINADIKNGNIKLEEIENRLFGVRSGFVAMRQADLEHRIIVEALEAIGVDASNMSPVTFERTVTRYANTISEYAATHLYGKNYDGYYNRAEIFSEAMLDFQANGENVSKFSMAIRNKMIEEGSKYSMAAEPGRVMEANGLKPTKGLLNKDGEYNFPDFKSDIYTVDEHKAKWLNEYRKNNPYVKGNKIFTEEEYKLANLWDTYFKKEIESYASHYPSSAPDSLIKKNGDFLEDFSNKAIKEMMDKIKEASVEGFDERIATIALSKNSDDISDALENYLISRVNRVADEVSKNLAEDGSMLDSARKTVWGDNRLRNEAYNIVSSLIPDLQFSKVKEIVDDIFDTQKKGYAEFEKLPIETASLYKEREMAMRELSSSNSAVMKAGKKSDQNLKNQGYIDGTSKVIHYREGGKDVYVLIDDPVIASVLKRPNDYKEHGIMSESIVKMANFFSRTYRLGTTGISLPALINNMLRDPVQAVIQGGFNPFNMSLSPTTYYKSLRTLGLDDATINDVMARIKTWASSSTLTQEMRGHGLENPNSIGYRNNFEKNINKFTDKTLNSKTIKILESPLEGWESMFRTQIGMQAFEKNFKKTGDVGKAMGEAMFATSNSTTNFSHALGHFSKFTSTVPYLSSAINGTASFWRMFNIDPVGMVLRITAGFMIPAMAITAWNLSSEERRETYMNLEDWYRDGHIVLVTMDNSVLSVPIPEELQQYYGTIRRLIEYTQDANAYSIPNILAQGAFGFLPVDTSGFFKENGEIDLRQGLWTLGSGLLPQAFTAIYEFAYEQNLFTGQDISGYNWINKTINTLANLFGTSAKNIANDIGLMLGVSSDELVGKSTMETIARNQFGLGFNAATNQFMNLIGNASGYNTETNKEVKATGLFKESEDLEKKIEAINKQIAYADDDEKTKLEEEKQSLINEFTERVKKLVNKYMEMYTITGGLEDWQRSKIISLLNLGKAYSSAASSSYQAEEASAAAIDEYSLGRQRYVDAGLPSGPTLESIARKENGDVVGSIGLQAAINKYYGTSKQATTDVSNAFDEANIKEIRNKFYAAVQAVYDYADKTNTTPDYDMIEKIQARYLQSVDAVLVPIIQKYGINILNNSTFIDKVEKFVNGMIPSNDWKQSSTNARKYLSTKQFPLATVNVKKWLIERYTSNMVDRGLGSDAEVTQQLESIKNDIDNGRHSTAKGKIESLRDAIKKSSYYISETDLKTLSDYYSMVK